MPTADLFPDLFDGFTTTAHFSEATIRAVEMAIEVGEEKAFTLLRNIKKASPP